MPKSPMQRLAEDYTSTALDYETLWGPSILPMALPLLDRLPFDDAARVLDVGAGVGGLFEHLRRRAPGAYVCGIDRSGGMLRLAAARHGHRFAVMDAQALGIRSSAFDVVTMVFMLFHLPDPSAGLREAARVLDRGGKIGVVTWADEPGLPGAEIWVEELDRAGAGPDARDESVRQHGLVDDPGKVRALLEPAGFTVDTIWTQPFEREWEPALLLNLQSRCGPQGRRLATLAAAERAATTDRVRPRLEALRSDQLTWRCEILYAVAVSD